MENRSFKHFYIDCTTTYFEGRNDGIARVTRMLVEMAGVPREMGYGEVHPVVFSNDRYYVLPNCEIFKDNPFAISKPVPRVRRFAARCRKKLLSMILPSKAGSRLSTDRHEKLRKTFPGALRSMEEADLSEDDFVVLPEFFREDQFRRLIELKSRLKLAGVIHDLIPITHPEYCDCTLRFNELAKFTSENADIVIAASRYSAACFEAYEKVLELGGAPVGKKKITWFHPGCDLDCDPAPPPPSAGMTKVFSDGVPVYLVCSTIEPRKNHLLILRTFQQLWAEGHAIKLLFVGKYGWMAEQTLREMTRHPELNKRFFWLSRASDADLAYAYRHCHATICASHVEGFGLPLVEALAAGRQVIFSRIKSFEEIVPAGFLVNSFAPDKPEELLLLIRKTLQANDRLDLDGFKPVSWREAAKEFYRILAESTDR